MFKNGLKKFKRDSGHRFAPLPLITPPVWDGGKTDFVHAKLPSGDTQDTHAESVSTESSKLPSLKGEDSDSVSIASFHTAYGESSSPTMANAVVPAVAIIDEEQTPLRCQFDQRSKPANNATSSQQQQRPSLVASLLFKKSHRSVHNSPSDSEAAAVAAVPRSASSFATLNPVSNDDPPTTLNNNNAKSEPDNHSIASSVACRNCWDSEGDLISPCRCAGTNGFVHRECLEAWLRQSGLRQCNVCGQSFPVQCKMKPLREWKLLPKCDHRVILFVGLTLTTLFLVGWLLYGIISSLVKDTGDEIDVTHYTISFVWLGVIIVTWIPLFIGTRKHLVATYYGWLHQNQHIFLTV